MSSPPPSTGTEPARELASQTVYDRPLPKKYCKLAALAKMPGGWALMLDDMPVKTPLKHELIIPGHCLAKAILNEWQARQGCIDPSFMPLTQLACMALDRVELNRQQIIEEIVEYANSDLLCYRAEQPVELVSRQAKAWDPVTRWLHNETGAPVKCFAGVRHCNQSLEFLKGFREKLEPMSSFLLAGFHTIMTLTGSAMLAMAALCEFCGADDLWSIAHIDEDWQIEQWGIDKEAALRHELRRREFGVTLEYIGLVKQA